MSQHPVECTKTQVTTHSYRVIEPSDKPQPGCAHVSDTGLAATGPPTTHLGGATELPPLELQLQFLLYGKERRTLQQDARTILQAIQTQCHGCGSDGTDYSIGPPRPLEDGILQIQVQFKALAPNAG